MLISPFTDAQAQSTTEIIRGRVFGPDSVPLAQAEVRVTGLVSRMSQTARTDARGSYTLVFPQAEGEYLVGVRRVGFQTASFRLSRVGISPVLGSNVYLRSVSQVLERVVVTAGPMVGERSAIGEVGAGALADSLFLADPSRLMELLLSIPGISALDDSTFSVLGAAPTGNVTTLDGVSVRGQGGGLPPDAVQSVRIVTSSADPARGGFSGGNVSQTLRGGTDILGGSIRFATSNRGLVWKDPAWNRPVNRPINHSGTVNGPIIKQKLRFNISWQAEDNAADWYSLLNPRGALLAQRGISLDSVSAVTSALVDLGIPLSIAAAPNEAHNRQLRTTEVFDFAPNATTSIRLSHNGSWQRNIGNNGSEVSFPTRVNELSVVQHSFGLRSTHYVRGLLNEFTAGYNYYSDDSDPYTLLPGGSVRVGTAFADGRTGLSSLTFGGGEGDYYEQSRGGEATNELSWLPASGRHKVKIGGRAGFNRSNYFYFPGSPLLGSYTYLTIEDLLANRPASYDRVITNTPRNTNSRNSSVWIGDEWKASDAWQLQGGLRLDFAHPGTVPKYNPAVDQTFGVRTDRIPEDVGVSPRIGFSWASRGRRGQGTAGGASTLGGMSANALRQMSPDMVSSIVAMQRATTLPGVAVSGTVGAYRGTVSTGTVAELVESTGLPGTRVTLSCVGDAVPVPDWRTMTVGPSSCADGTNGTTFSLSKPLVRVFDPGFEPPMSWRSSLGIDGIRVPGKWILTINGGFSYNVNGQSTVDLNLNRIPQFFLTGEGGRPVFAPVNAVVPSTGSISSGASRRSPDFATVSSLLSDLRSYRAEFQASIAPPNPLLNRRLALSLSYQLNAGRNETRGNSRIGTIGDPYVKQWVPISNPQHTFRLTSGGRFWGFNFGLTTNLYSGIPLTPLVNGDINGDGNTGNDRAFIPDPAALSDTSLARQMNDLISSAPSAARKCILSQRGRMAGANSCRTPWQARFDINASLTPPSGWSYSDRLRLTFDLSNANGALVRALGLENTPLGQSPLSTNPNATLFYVTGFDPNTNQFKYRVNQLFGQPTNFGSARRKFAPTQLRFGLEYSFGGPVPNPISRGLGLREPVNERPLTDEQRRQAVAKLKRDPAVAVAALSDSLSLTPEQRSQLAAISIEYNARADTALAPLRNWVLRQGRRVFDRDLAQRLSAAQSALGKLNTEYGRKAQEVLTAEQLTRFKESSQRKER
ncbi:MAG TPA: carboxypeptidase regulatory-like domain-containing protein [Gemmatimonadaceae bacterium]|nr:carboxypeptidase regulatory-like domain-containing protein [Gemmatimonadaceae bacterium]